MIEVTAFEDKKLFKPIANYVFEGLDLPERYELTDTYRKEFSDAVNFFMSLIVNSHNYLISIPDFSSFNDAPKAIVKGKDLGPELISGSLSEAAWENLGGIELDSFPDEELPF